MGTSRLTSDILIAYIRQLLNREEILYVETALLEDPAAAEEMDMLWELQEQGELDNYLTQMGWKDHHPAVPLPLTSDRLLAYVEEKLTREEVLLVEAELLDNEAAADEVNLLRELQETQELNTFLQNHIQPQNKPKTDEKPPEKIRKLIPWWQETRKIAAVFILFILSSSIYLLYQYPSHYDSNQVRGADNGHKEELLNQLSEISPGDYQEQLFTIYAYIIRYQLDNLIWVDSLLCASFYQLPETDQKNAIGNEVIENWQDMPENGLVSPNHFYVLRRTLSGAELYTHDGTFLHRWNGTYFSQAAFSPDSRLVAWQPYFGTPQIHITPLGIKQWLEGRFGE